MTSRKPPTPCKATLLVQYDAVNESWNWSFRIPRRHARVIGEGLHLSTKEYAVADATKLANQIGVLIGDVYHNEAWDRKRNPKIPVDNSTATGV